MTDPKRWLDEGSGATSEERELLQAGRQSKMPNALRRRVWLGIAVGSAGIGAASEAAGGAMVKGAASSSALSVLSSTAAKGVLALALLGGAGLGVSAVRSPPKVVSGAAGLPARAAGVAPSIDAPPAVPSVAVESAVGSDLSPAVATTTAADEAKPRVAAELRTPLHHALPARAHDEAASRPAEPTAEFRAASRLREESAAVLAIRKTLLGGDAVEALRMLDRARADFPRGTLTQEREALTVRALAASGQKESARTRAEAFLRMFPRSPYAADVRALLAP